LQQNHHPAHTSYFVQCLTILEGKWKTHNHVTKRKSALSRSKAAQEVFYKKFLSRCCCRGLAIEGRASLKEWIQIPRNQRVLTLMLLKASSVKTMYSLHCKEYILDIKNVKSGPSSHGGNCCKVHVKKHHRYFLLAMICQFAHQSKVLG